MGKNKKQGYKPNPIKLRNKLYCYSPGRVKEQTVEENKALYESIKNKGIDPLQDLVEKYFDFYDVENPEFVKQIMKKCCCDFIFQQLQHITKNYADDTAYTKNNTDNGDEKQTGIIVEAIGDSFIIRDADFNFIQVYDNIQDILEVLKPVVFSIINLFTITLNKIKDHIIETKNPQQMPIEERFTQALASIIEGKYSQIIGHDMAKAMKIPEIEIEIKIEE